MNAYLQKGQYYSCLNETKKPVRQQPSMKEKSTSKEALGDFTHVSNSS